MESVESLIRQWDGESVVMQLDRPTGTWIVIAIHSTRLGPATGGTRLKPYPHLAAAVEDALRLARAMTYKFAVTGFPRGGGKAVIAPPASLAPSDRTGLLRRYGVLIGQLGGLFEAGPDVGTSSADMDVIAETGAPHVFCRTSAAGGAGDSAPATALGVFHAVLASCEWVFGDRSLADRRVLVQGAGSVGGRLIELLRAAGAAVLISDVDETAIYHFQDQLGISFVPPEAVYDTPCDIFSPCALGGVLDRETIRRLRCRAIAGSANNQLATPEDAERLRERHILYAPDFIASLGGAMAITAIEAMGWPRAEAEGRMTELITRTLMEVFRRAEREGTTTVAAAERIAEDRLAREASVSSVGSGS